MKRLFVASAMLLFLNAMAGAQSNSMYQGQMDRIDRDGNGKVSRSEYQSFMRSAFSRLDTNKDGELQPNEAKQVLTPAQVTAIDTDRDGNVSRDEFMRQVMADFAVADRSGDGTLQ